MGEGFLSLVKAYLTMPEKQNYTQTLGRLCESVFIVAPCILWINLIYYTPTNALLYYGSLKSSH